MNIIFPHIPLDGSIFLYCFDDCKYVCISHTNYPDFLAQKLGVRIIHENYKVNIFWFRNIQDRMAKNLATPITQSNELYTVTENYPLESIFIYNLLSLGPLA